MIYGLDAEEIPEGCIALEGIAVVKVLDEEGETAVYVRATPGLMVWDAIGLLTMAVDAERNRAQTCFEGPEEGDDDG